MSEMGADAQWSTHTGVNPVPHALYRSGGGPSAPNPHPGPAFCLLSIIIDMASSLSAICRLLCTQLPALFQEGLSYKGGVAPSALRGAVLDPQPPPTHPLFSGSQLWDTTVQQLPHSKSQARDEGLLLGPRCPSVTQLGPPQRTRGPAARCLNGARSPGLSAGCIFDATCDAESQTGLIWTRLLFYPQGARKQFSITHTTRRNKLAFHIQQVLAGSQLPNDAFFFISLFFEP